jgi:hypothetical protein
VTGPVERHGHVRVPNQIGQRPHRLVRLGRIPDEADPRRCEFDRTLGPGDRDAPDIDAPRLLRHDPEDTRREHTPEAPRRTPREMKSPLPSIDPDGGRPVGDLASDGPQATHDPIGDPGRERPHRRQRSDRTAHPVRVVWPQRAGTGERSVDLELIGSEAS